MVEFRVKELTWRRWVWPAVSVVAVGVLIGLLFGGGASGADEREARGETGPTDRPADPHDPIAAPKNAEEFPHDPPDLEYFPCSDCHADMEPNLERRELEDEHTDIVLHHGPRERWCFDCHNPDDRDKLRLASGTLIDFEDSYRLCGQCHGPKLRDWRVGIHGKRTGEWNGKKKYYLCAHCHNPHSPKFKPLEPLPPPMRPGDIR